MSEFHKSRHTIDGKYGHCKECVSTRMRIYHMKNAKRNYERTRKWVTENPEKTRAYKAAWKKRNPQKELASVQRRNAIKRGLPSGFTVKDWQEIQEFFDYRCIYCGKPDVLQQDHFLPVALGGGYIRGNIAPSCCLCNTTKSSKHPRVFVEEGRLKQPYRQLLVKLCYA